MSGSSIKISPLRISMAVVAAALTVIVVGAPPASASVGGPGYASATTTVACNPLNHYMTISLSIRYPGQIVWGPWTAAYRLQVYSYRLGKWFTGNWVSHTIGPTGASSLTDGSWSPSESIGPYPPGTYYVYMDYGWLLSTGWSYAHEYISTYTSAPTTSYCYL